MREYLDPVVKAKESTQYVYDIGIAAKTATDPNRNFQPVFEWIRKTGLKLTVEKCYSGLRQLEFFARPIS